VVDDEWYSLEEICELVEKSGFMTVVKKYTNPLLALEEAVLLAPQVAFLDIEMPEINGISLADRLCENLPSIRVVFITAYNRYAVEAFTLNALDYLLKPIDENRFLKMMDRIRLSFISSLPEKTRIKINCFGRLDVFMDDLAVKWQRSSAEELFAFLIIHHGEPVYKDTIIENLWPDYPQKKALQLLQTSIYKIRTVFSGLSASFVLEYSGNRYRLLISNAECDYFTVCTAMREFRRENPASFPAVETVAALCRKELFSEQGYLWSMEKDEALRTALIRMISQIASFYQAENDTQKLIGALQRLIEFTPYDEQLNTMLLNIMERMELSFEMETHSRWLKRALHDEYDMPIPASLEHYCKE